MRAFVILMLVAATVALPATMASHTGCDPNGYGYTCHMNVGPVCEEMELRVGQPSTWYTCTGDNLRDLLP